MITILNAMRLTLQWAQSAKMPKRVSLQAKPLKHVIGAVLALCVALLFSPGLHAEDVKPQPRDVALWLARSCVGEANFDSAETGECAALLHVYAKRARITGKTIYEIVRIYSAAVKWRKHHPRFWIFQLNRNATEPKKWPKKKKKWSSVEYLWLDVLWLCDDFLKGKVVNPVPEADHYGSKVDEWRAVDQHWRKLRVPSTFKNQFWNINVKRKKKELSNGN